MALLHTAGDGTYRWQLRCHEAPHASSGGRPIGPNVERAARHCLAYLGRDATHGSRFGSFQSHARQHIQQTDADTDVAASLAKSRPTFAEPPTKTLIAREAAAMPCRT